MKTVEKKNIFNDLTNKKSDRLTVTSKRQKKKNETDLNIIKEEKISNLRQMNTTIQNYMDKLDRIAEGKTININANDDMEDNIENKNKDSWIATTRTEVNNNNKYEKYISALNILSTNNDEINK